MLSDPRKRPLKYELKDGTLKINLSDCPIPIAEINKYLYIPAMIKKILSGIILVLSFSQLTSCGHGLNGYKGPMWDEWQTKVLIWLTEKKYLHAKNKQ